MANKVTMKDVANAAGVSVASVSRAFENNGDKIKDQTRLRILEAAKELGYSPNRLAQGLATGSNQVIRIIVPNLQNPWLACMLEELDQELTRHGFESSVHFCHMDLRQLEDQIRIAVENRVRGIVLFPSDFSDYPPLIYRELMSQATPPLPIVLVSDRFITQSRYVVNGDNVAGAKLAVEHLIELGHKRIGMITGAMTNSSLRDRYEGYKAAHQLAGLEIDESLIGFDTFSVDSSHAFRCVESLMNRDDRPTGVFVCSDFMALPVLRYIKSLGLSIPEDVSVVGFDNIDLCEHLADPLTTIEFSIADMVVMSI